MGDMSLSTSHAVVPYEKMLRHQHPTHFPSVEDVKRALAEEDYRKMLDLRPYTNQGCFTVPEHASATRCFRLFRSMGLRHLPVLGSDHEVVGIITRQSLLAVQEGHVKPCQQKVSQDIFPSLLATQEGPLKPGQRTSQEAALGAEARLHSFSTLPDRSIQQC